MKTTWISCGVLQRELESLLHDNLIQGNLIVLDSMLHMNPARLEAVLRVKLADFDHNAPLVLVFGDCCHGMIDVTREFRIARVDSVNCAQMLLGRERYHEMMQREVFMFLPEWAERWETVFKKELGLHTMEQAHAVVGENRKELIYLDTGLSAVPEEIMQACSEYTGLPWRSETVSLRCFLELLQQAEKRAIKILEERYGNKN